MLPDVLIHPQDSHSVQVVRGVVDQCAAGCHGDVVDQFSSDTEGFGGRRDAHAVDCEALEDPAGDPVGELGAVIGAAQGGLEDLPGAGGVGAGEPGYPDVQTGRGPDDGKAHQVADDMIALGAGLGAFRTGVADGHRGGVDDGDGAGIGGTGDGQADFHGKADGVGDEVVTRLHSRVGSVR